MLSSPVYAEPYPRPPVSHPHMASISFCSSQPSSLPTCQHENDVQASSKSSHPWPLLSRQHHAPVSPLAATLMDLPASVANKRLTANLTPLDATLTKNRGEGCALSFTPFHQIPAAPVFSSTYKLPIFYPLCFDIHPCNGGVPPSSTFPTFRRGDALCDVQQLCDTLCRWEFCGGSHAGWEHKTT
jgi:hypothetical protein